MGFRTLEISNAAEIHVKDGQLEVTTEEGTVHIPVEDLNQIMVHGANIRLSTMDLSILAQNRSTRRKKIEDNIIIHHRRKYFVPK